MELFPGSDVSQAAGYSIQATGEIQMSKDQVAMISTVLNKLSKSFLRNDKKEIPNVFDHIKDIRIETQKLKPDGAGSHGADVSNLGGYVDVAKNVLVGALERVNQSPVLHKISKDFHRKYDKKSIPNIIDYIKDIKIHRPGRVGRSRDDVSNVGGYVDAAKNMLVVVLESVNQSPMLSKISKDLLRKYDKETIPKIIDYIKDVQIDRPGGVNRARDDVSNLDGYIDAAKNMFVGVLESVNQSPVLKKLSKSFHRKYNKKTIPNIIDYIKDIQINGPDAVSRSRDDVSNLDGYVDAAKNVLVGVLENVNRSPVLSKKSKDLLRKYDKKTIPNIISYIKDIQIDTQKRGPDGVSRSRDEVIDLGGYIDAAKHALLGVLDRVHPYIH